MKYAVYNPLPIVEGLIRYFWVLESTPNSKIPPVYQAMADSCAELIFQYDGGFLEFGKNKASYVAQKSISKRRTLDTSVGMFGVRFYPYAMQDLLRLPSNELSNSVHDLHTLFGREGSDLVDQILNASTTGERIEIATHFFSRKIKMDRTDHIKQIVKEVLISDGHISIKDIQEKSGFSERQFERRFTLSAGFTPKYLTRIVRFQSVKRNYIAGNFKTLSQLALSSGYFDQSHFIREFKEFSGMNPNNYFKLFDQENKEEARIIKGLIVEKEKFSR